MCALSKRVHLESRKWESHGLPMPSRLYRGERRSLHSLWRRHIQGHNWDWQLRDVPPQIHHAYNGLDLESELRLQPRVRWSRVRLLPERDIRPWRIGTVPTVQGLRPKRAHNGRTLLSGRRPFRPCYLLVQDGVQWGRGQLLVQSHSAAGLYLGVPTGEWA